jgi:hypothetical protein
LGHISVATALITYTIYNFVIMHVFLNATWYLFLHRFRNKSFYMPLGMLIWIVLAISCWYTGLKKWERDDFDHFRNHVSVSTAFQFVSYILTLVAFRTGKIKVPEGFPVSNEVAMRVLKAAIGLVLLAVACAFTAMPIFQYPGTGSTFTAMVIVVALVGEMDYMGEKIAPTNDNMGEVAPAAKEDTIL